MAVDGCWAGSEREAAEREEAGEQKAAKGAKACWERLRGKWGNRRELRTVGGEAERGSRVLRIEKKELRKLSESACGRETYGYYGRNNQATPAMTLALNILEVPVQEEVVTTAAAAQPVENVTLVAALTCVMSAVYFLATSLVG